MTQLSDLVGTWQIDPAHSAVGFSLKHAMISTVRGSFGDFAGTIEVTGPTTAEVKAAIKADSISTNNEQRDGHLKTSDFFDTATYPEITFVSTDVRDIDGDEFVLVGDLTIRGVTKPVELRTEFAGTQVDADGLLRAGFEAATTINRKDFGLTWNAALDTGGVLVGDRIKIAIDIAAVKQA
ncbi:YceI family protein [Enemella sp. A6]|uniref:YceI family protein n=1 Tax=Enemella sp. A6 TaxID=3440152 RepID=UPI003EBC2658